MTDIAVIGTGYVGLVTGACFAEFGHNVTCVDLRQSVVDAINTGKSPIFESGLGELIASNTGTRLRATTDVKSAVRSSTVSFVAVGTPFNGEQISLSQVDEAARSIGDALKDAGKFHVVVVKSTVVPGTTRDRVLPAIEKASGKKLGEGWGIAMNPEFLREGEAVNDFLRPDRIVLGVEEPRAFDVLSDLYAPFSAPLVRCNTKTAEMIKYSSNSLFASLISFSNEIANLCAAFGDIDVVDVMRGVHSDRRLSPEWEAGRNSRPGFLSYLAAGCGFGGSCFPKDVNALIAHGRDHGYRPELLSQVMSLNNRQPARMIELLKRHFPVLKDVQVALLGLAFKSGTDDVRESPALPILRQLLAEGARVRVYDPVARLDGENLGGHYDVSPSLMAAVDGMDAVLVVTPWSEFEALDRLLSSNARPPLLVDGRRSYSPERFARYEGIGR